MIDRERFENLSTKALASVAEFADTIDCEGVQCTDCPFELAPAILDDFPFLGVCALTYGKALYKRCTK